MPEPLGVQRNHREMVKFSHKADHGLQPVSNFLAAEASRVTTERDARHQAIQRTRAPNKQPPPLANGQEDELAILHHCDTVFLVDDSPSMGKRWDLLMTILGDAVNKATCYDWDGVDIYLMNNMQMSEKNVRSQAMASAFLSKVQPTGSTPIYYWLCRLLDNFLYKYNKHGKEVDFKNYNLIVITDGEPNPEDESDDEISDQEDAEQNKGAYRLIRKKIVETAKYLDENRAPKDLLGIQFCQIGNNEEAAQFFKYLDDDIKKKNRLKRDVSDLFPLPPTVLD